MNTHTLSRVVTAFAACCACIALAVPAHADDDTAPTTSSDRLTGPQRALLTQATRRFAQPSAAVAAGYMATDTCAELPGTGAMGYHYVNPQYASSPQIDPAHPAILVYVPTRRHGLRLGALEYFHADADQDLTTDGDRPSLFAHHPFQGPMTGHEPGMPIHYDLHVWLYKHNPAGQLQPWNPAVHCPTN